MTTSVYVVFGLVLLGLSQISAISDEDRNLLIKAVHDNCVKETGVPEQMITDCASGIFADDDRLKCYMKCLLVTAGVINVDTGEWHLKLLEIIIPDDHKDHAIPVLNECGVIKGTDICDTAFQTNKCWQSKAPGRYYLP